jgi:hypothetical protein
VTINTAELTVEMAAEIVLNMLGQKLAVELKGSTSV